MHDCPYMPSLVCKCFDEIREVSKVTNPDPNSYIQESAVLLGATLVSKNSDYAPTGEFSNFEKAADFIGGGMDPFSVMMGQIAIKYTRIESLRSSEVTNFESIADSLMDLAGYAIIAHAYLEYTLDQREN